MTSLYTTIITIILIVAIIFIFYQLYETELNNNKLSLENDGFILVKNKQDALNKLPNGYQEVTNK